MHKKDDGWGLQGSRQNYSHLVRIIDAIILDEELQLYKVSALYMLYKCFMNKTRSEECRYTIVTCRPGIVVSRR